MKGAIYILSSIYGHLRTTGHSRTMATIAEIQAMNGRKSGEGSSVSAVPEGKNDLHTMMEEIKRLRMENEEFKKRQRPVSFSVSDKGAISVHGIGKYPFTLYKVQWERILDKSADLRQFIKDHEIELS